MAGIGRGHLETVLGSGAVAALDDDELLARLASAPGDAADLAFAAIVARHGPMVLGVCRRILGDGPAADDAFQATFLVLALRARRLGVRRSLGGWLHGVSRRVAVRSRARRSRLAPRGVAADRPGPIPPDPAESAELRAVLDDEIGRLPGGLREAVTLCLLQGLTLEEAAGRMGCAPGTAGSRLSRARGLLRSRLSRRGVAPAAVALEHAALPPAPPPELIRAAGTLLSAAPAGMVSPSIHALARSALREMTMARTLLAAPLALGGLALAGAALLAAPPADPPPPARPQAAPAPAPTRAADVPTPAPKPAEGSMRVVVVDPDGKPLPDAAVHSSIWTDDKTFRANRDYRTDVSGAAVVELPKAFTILRLWADRPPYAAMFAAWEEAELAGGRGVPAEFTIPLEPATAAAGRVVDEQGRPVAGARVGVMLAGPDLPRPARGGRLRYVPRLADDDNPVVTDADGRWQVRNVPAAPGVKLRLLVSHPDFLPDDRRDASRRPPGAPAAGPPRQEETVTLRRGVPVEGRVTDPDGNPVREGLVIHGDNASFANEVRDFPIGPDGRYRLPALPPGETRLTVIAPGWAPQMRRFRLEPGQPPQDFRLEPGRPIRLTIVDPAGRPIPRAEVQIAEWQGVRSLHNERHARVKDTKIPRTADDRGVYEWTWAPAAPVDFEVGGAGSARVPLKLAGGDPPRTVTLKPEHRITGRVTDAATGRPIPAFTAIPVDVFRPDWLVAERGNGKPGRAGAFSFLATRTDVALRLRVEAPGYRTQDGPEFRVGDDGGRAQDFALVPSPPVAGRVVDGEGRPVAGAEVLMATPSQEATLAGERGNQQATTDGDGRFAFPDPGAPWAVIARGAAGHAASDEFAADRHDAGTLRLRPWASVRGRFLDGGVPVRNANVFLQPVRVAGTARPRVDGMFQVFTDGDGRFEFPRVPPGPANVRIYLGPWQEAGFRSGPSVPLDLRPGQQADLDLGSGGATLSGRVVLAGSVPPGLDAQFSLNQLIRRGSRIAAPEADRLDFDPRRGGRANWLATEEGSAYLMTVPHWFVKLKPDGSFRVSGVPAGEYDLLTQVYARPDGCLVDPLARAVAPITVTEDDARRGSLAVPDVVATVAPAPAVGEAPALRYARPDGSAGSLADHRGKYLVVDFWASWCGPCREQAPHLRRVLDRFAARGVAALGLSLDEDEAAWRAALADPDRSGAQGRLADPGGTGVSTVPALWVLDPAGTIVARPADVDALARFLADLPR